MIEGDFQDFLIEKPVCLVFWELNTPLGALVDYLKNKGFEVKGIKEVKDLLYWLNTANVELIILGASKLEEVKEIKKFIDEKLPIEKRREIFVAYVVPGGKTLHPKEVFLYSANLVISEEHLNEFPRVYERAVRYWDAFYRNFKKAYSQITSNI
ncbi:MAG: hypothetical protein GXO57_04520 [Thermodesulfobacteria bacterium]|nr:hypothetical protein [Thermodesulfobacteriota bacterium]